MQTPKIKSSIPTAVGTSNAVRGIRWIQIFGELYFIQAYQISTVLNAKEV
jgi:hypothetical protein